VDAAVKGGGQSIEEPAQNAASRVYGPPAVLIPGRPARPERLYDG